VAAQAHGSIQPSAAVQPLGSVQSVPASSRASGRLLRLGLAREPDHSVTVSITIWPFLSAPWGRGLKAREGPYYWAAIILAPFLILLFDRNVYFSPPAFVDSWIYYGYFRHFSEFIRWFSGTYYASRLTWILPGYVVNKMFPDLIANYLLHFGVYYTAAFSLYYILACFFGRRTALLGTLALGTYPYLLQSVGWDYVDGAGIAYYLLTIALIVRVRNGPSRLRSALVGGAYAAAVYTNIVWVVFIPLVLGFYLLMPPSTPGPVWGPERLRRSSRFVGWFGIGALALTAGLCLVNYRAGGKLWFYGATVDWVLRNHAAISAQWHGRDYHWLKQATWLLLPAIASLVAAGRCFQRFVVQRDWSLDGVTLFDLHLLATIGVMVTLQAKGGYFLEYAFYGSYLIPSTVLALGGEVFYLKGRSGWLLLLPIAILFVPWLPWAQPVWGALSKINAVSLIGVTVAGLMGAALWRGRSAAVVVAAACLSLLSLYLLAYSGELAYRQAAPDARGQAFVRTTRAMKGIDRVRQGRKVLFWLDEHDRNGGEFESLAAIYMWGYFLIGHPFPALDPGRRWAASAGEMIAVPTTDRTESSVLRDANAALGKWGFTARTRAVVEVGDSITHYRIVCLDLLRLPRSGVTIVPNLATGMPAAQSSTVNEAAADRAVDGDTDGDFAHGSVTHTDLQKNAWWEVDLGRSVSIQSVAIWNRTDPCGSVSCGARLSDYWVFISDQPFLASDTPERLQRRAGTWNSRQIVWPNPSTRVAVNGARGRYVRIQLNSKNYLSLAEVQVF